MEIVQQNFKPEFINRIDDIVVFHPLGTEQIRAIVDIQLGLLRRRLLERDLELELDNAARDSLGEAGFDPVYGARPLKRAIQQQIENPLAQQDSGGQLPAGRSDPRGRGKGRAALRQGALEARAPIAPDTRRARPPIICRGELSRCCAYAVLRVRMSELPVLPGSAPEDQRQATEEMPLLRQARL